VTEAWWNLSNTPRSLRSSASQGRGETGYFPRVVVFTLHWWALIVTLPILGTCFIAACSRGTALELLEPRHHYLHIFRNVMPLNRPSKPCESWMSKMSENKLNTVSGRQTAIHVGVQTGMELTERKCLTWLCPIYFGQTPVGLLKLARFHQKVAPCLLIYLVIAVLTPYNWEHITCGKCLLTISSELFVCPTWNKYWIMCNNNFVVLYL
jgi:hypothetical protein